MTLSDYDLLLFGKLSDRTVGWAPTFYRWLAAGWAAAAAATNQGNTIIGDLLLLPFNDFQWWWEFLPPRFQWKDTFNSISDCFENWPLRQFEFKWDGRTALAETFVPPLPMKEFGLRIVCISIEMISAGKILARIVDNPDARSLATTRPSGKN